MNIPRRVMVVVALVQREPRVWTIKLEQRIIFIPLSTKYIQNLTALNKEPEQLCGDHLTIEDKVASSSFADGMISQHLLSTLLTRAPEVLLEASSACLESENQCFQPMAIYYRADKALRVGIFQWASEEYPRSKANEPRLSYNHDAAIVSPVEAAATGLQNPANRENPTFDLFRLLSSMVMDVRVQRMHMDWNDQSTPMTGPMPEIDLGILKATWLEFRFWHIVRWSEAKESVATRQFSMFSHGHSHQRQLLRRLKLESISTFLFQVPPSIFLIQRLTSLFHG